MNEVIEKVKKQMNYDYSSGLDIKKNIVEPA